VPRKSHAENREELKRATSWLDEYGIKHPGMRQFLLAYVKVGTISGACKALGFGYIKVNNWRKGFTTSKGLPGKPTDEGERFELAFEQAKVRRIELLEMELERRAIKGSDTLLMFRLRALKPEMYRETGKAGATGGQVPSPQVQVTVNQLIQTALQDPQKLEQVMDLAEKHGLLQRLMGPTFPVFVPDSPVPLEVKNPPEEVQGE
jgi:hypothetical protein